MMHDKDGKELGMSTGVIAQEVEKVLPEAITKDEDGYMAVAYGNMVGLLIEGIKTLNQSTADLHAESVKMHEKQVAMMTRMKEMEAQIEALKA